jgi:hypothetical protein
MSALRVIVPIVLGVIAAILNFIVIKGSTSPLELTSIRTDIKADTEIAEDMLERVQVRADKEIFKSAVPYSERGLLLGRRVTRPMSAGEVVLYADVHNLDEENIRLFLKPGETTLTIPVKSSRVAPSLRRGDSVGVLVSVRPAPDPTKTGIRPPTSETRMLGPFRLLSLGAPVDPYRGAVIGDTRLLLIAIKPGPKGQVEPAVATLQEAIASSASSSGGESGVLAVEYFQQRP